MKRINKLHIASIVICMISFGIYQGYQYYESKNTDYSGPVFEMEEPEITVKIEDGVEALLEGLTATDEKDGDVSDSIVVESVSKFIGDTDTKTVTYVAFDDDKNVGKATRTVKYEDYTSPKFSSETGFRFPLDTTDLLTGLNADDCIDGDITSQVRVSATYYINTEKAGLHEFQYQVTNSSGDVEYLPVTVEIYDPSEQAGVPQIYLKKYIAYTSKGREINPSDYLDYVTINGMGADEASVIIDDSDVDYDEPGTYEITYRMQADEEHVGTNRLVVVVR